MHADFHAMAFHPTNPNILFFGNDGGVYKTTNGGTSFVNLNNGLNITQFYYGAIHPTSDKIMAERRITELFYPVPNRCGTLLLAEMAAHAKLTTQPANYVRRICKVMLYEKHKRRQFF